MNACDSLVTQDLDGLDAKNEQQQLGRDRPADHEPILLRQERESPIPSYFLRVHIILTNVNTFLDNDAQPTELSR